MISGENILRFNCRGNRQPCSPAWDICNNSAGMRQVKKVLLEMGRPSFDAILVKEIIPDIKCASQASPKRRDLRSA